jgi:hypothetical protein
VFPRVAKRNPGLEFANAFSVIAMEVRCGLIYLKGVDLDEITASHLAISRATSSGFPESTRLSLFWLRKLFHISRLLESGSRAARQLAASSLLRDRCAS